jgi:hypothetical protein
MLVGIEKTVVEGAGAAGLAAMLSEPERYKGKKVATLLRRQYRHHLLANVLVRDLVRQGRIASFASRRTTSRAPRGDYREGLRSGRQRHRDQAQRIFTGFRPRTR